MTQSFAFTILTPTFNRAHTLPALKASLDTQTFRDFEWLVVDDESMDGTADLFAGWTAKSAYPIRILRCENGGKHRALNRGIPECRGRWIFIVDSDDQLPVEALAKIAALMPEAEADPSIGGIMGFRQDSKGRRIGEDFPPNLLRRDAATLTFIDGLRGDKAEVFKASVLRRFPFPELQGEKFITECVVWFRIARAGFDLLLLRDAIYTCEYQEDGLSARSFELRLKNPEGTLLFYSEEIALPYPIHSLYREAANFVRFWLLSRGRRASPRQALNPKAKFLIAIASPAGLLAAMIDVARLAAGRLKSR